LTKKDDVILMNIRIVFLENHTDPATPEIALQLIKKIKANPQITEPLRILDEVPNDKTVKEACQFFDRGDQAGSESKKAFRKLTGREMEYADVDEKKHPFFKSLPSRAIGTIARSFASKQNKTLLQYIDDNQIPYQGMDLDQGMDLEEQEDELFAVFSDERNVSMAKALFDVGAKALVVARMGLLHYGSVFSKFTDKIKAAYSLIFNEAEIQKIAELSFFSIHCYSRKPVITEQAEVCSGAKKHIRVMNACNGIQENSGTISFTACLENQARQKEIVDQIIQELIERQQKLAKLISVGLIRYKTSQSQSQSQKDSTVLFINQKPTELPTPELSLAKTSKHDEEVELPSVIPKDKTFSKTSGTKNNFFKKNTDDEIGHFIIEILKAILIQCGAFLFPFSVLICSHIQEDKTKNKHKMY